MKTYITKLQDGDNRTQVITFAILLTLAVVAYLVFN